MAQQELKVVVVGDSMMWGQGLKESDKFALKASQQLAKLLGRELKTVENTARSGACIIAGKSEAERRKNRDDFLDTYPTLFHSPQEITDFLENNIQEVPRRLYGENPCTFPTISYQVQRINDDVGRSIDLVIMNGGANDLDFQAFLNVMEHQKDFVRHFDPQLEEIFHDRVLSLLRQARKKFPNALLVYTGYYTPFMPEISTDEVKELLKHESGKPGWLIWLGATFSIEGKDIDELTRLGQIRAQYGLARGLHWIRQAVTEANEDPAVRGPGILFVHPQFGAENTVFARNSFLHREYEVDKVKDAAKATRLANCIRCDEAFESLRSFFDELLREEADENIRKLKGEPVDPLAAGGRRRRAAQAAQRALDDFDGPTHLLDLCQTIAEGGGGSPGPWSRISGICESELGRIENVKRASFIHPNEKGALRYTGVIVKRFSERHHHIRALSELLKLTKKGRGGTGKKVSVKDCLRRYHLKDTPTLRTLIQFLLVDAVRIEITTAPDSDEDMQDDIVLNLGGKNQFRLNFPPFVVIHGNGKAAVKKLHPHFEPGAKDDFTVDAGGIHLGSITQFTVERVVHPSIGQFAGVTSEEIADRIWKPTSVKLHINGKTVFDVPIFTTIKRGEKLTFTYPAK